MGTTTPLERVTELLDRVAETGPATDESRRPNRDVFRAMADADLLHLMVPLSAGGPQHHLRTLVEVTEAVARVHGSSGWTLMTCNEEAGIASAFIAGDSMRALLGADPTPVVAGSGVPHGRARRVDGGWRLTGRWGFVSGCTVADLIVLAALVEGTEPRQMVYFLVPQGEAVIEDTWHTVGLRGTGSHDVVLDGHFVPAAHGGETLARRPESAVDAPFYRFPSRLRFPFPKTGVAAGIARAALAEFGELAGAKKPLNAKAPLRNRPGAQRAVAEGEAKVAGGKAWVSEVLDEVWEVVSAGDQVSADLHARARLSCSWAVKSCIETVEGLCAAAGSTANFESSPLGRHLVDVKAVAAHFMVAPYQIDTAGRVLLGLDPEDQGF